MNDAFSEYVALLDDVEHIPLAARQLPSLSSEERAAVMERVVNFVRDSVLPQSDREEEGVEALFYSGVAAGDDEPPQRRRDHDAIVEHIEELAHIDPRNGDRVQELLYRLYGTIAGHFGDAELMVVSAPDVESPPTQRRSTSGGLGSAADMGGGDYVDRTAELVAAHAFVYRM